jgi:uncharacterized protein (TIGR02598 family)
MNFLSHSPNARRKPRARGFSLIEIVLAIGIVSFAAMAIVGALPAGLQVVHDARVQAATANIVGQLRGELQQIPFNAGSSTVSMANLEDKNYLYTADGVFLGEEGTAQNPGDAYYKAVFELDPASVLSAAATDARAYGTEHARVIKVTLLYPQSAPPENQQRSVFSLFASRQTAREATY